ncbi:MAG: Dam family site-specific DNA-(adenine-N6)-methyltransferase [Candidatus Cloacimonetes bacterium]|nr:Dam family site-specific DNA-(adenine-N6)-methyltransferase [Candidatus Cloacimonadota bacterium]
MNRIKVPHPFPYQGSKRNIAHHILPYFPPDIDRLFEPFCGAGAVSIAAAAHGLASKFHLNDINIPLMNLWEDILNNPKELVNKYEILWIEQHHDKKKFFYTIRDDFNRSHKTHHLLYLLARIVKGSVRYSSEGKFNQSADNRRAGMRPNTMRRQIYAVSHILSKRTTTSAYDFWDVLSLCKEHDLVYMDPPYQGTSFTRDHRYCGGLSFDDFVESLNMLNNNGISYIISYDGKTGDKSHGKILPSKLKLKHSYIYAGRSSQETLLGNTADTLESLYISPSLVNRINFHQCERKAPSYVQQELVFS